MNNGKNILNIFQKRLEKATQEGNIRCPIDVKRYVDFKIMAQREYDNEMSTRRVKRVVTDEPFIPVSSDEEDNEVIMEEDKQDPEILKQREEMKKLYQKVNKNKMIQKHSVQPYKDTILPLMKCDECSGNYKTNRAFKGGFTTSNSVKKIEEIIIYWK